MINSKRTFKKSDTFKKRQLKRRIKGNTEVQEREQTKENVQKHRIKTKMGTFSSSSSKKKTERNDKQAKTHKLKCPTKRYTNKKLQKFQIHVLQRGLDRENK